jgi:hypothetical protein
MAGRSNLLAVSGEFALVERTDPSTTSMPTEGEYKYACFFSTIEREREDNETTTARCRFSFPVRKIKLSLEVHRNREPTR